MNINSTPVVNSEISCSATIITHSNVTKVTNVSPWPWPQGLVLGLVHWVINWKAKMMKCTVIC